MHYQLTLSGSRQLMAPTVGRVVHFWPAYEDSEACSNSNAGPLAAVITRVHSDEIVNLLILPDYNAPPGHRTSIKLWSGLVEEGPDRPSWSWPERV